MKIKNKKISTILYNFARCSINIIAIIVLFIIALMMITTRVWINSSEQAVFSSNSFGFILGTIICVSLFVYLGKFLKKIQPKHLFILGTIIWTLMGLVYLFKAPDVVNPASTDQRLVYEFANQLLQGNVDFFKDDYMLHYPFQLGLITYDAFIIWLSDNIYFLYIVNLFFAIVINYLTWQCTKLFIGSKQLLQNYTIILSFAFLPLLYFILFAYGNIPGFLAMFAAVYYGLRYLKDSDTYRFSWVLMIVFGAIAYVLKSNYLIPVIALAIIYFLKAILRKNYLIALMAVLLVGSLSASIKMVNGLYEQKYDVKISQGVPKVAWITMGFDGPYGGGNSWLVYRLCLWGL